MSRPLLVSGDARCVDELQRLVAAAGGEGDIAPDAAAARRGWTTAPVVLVGDDAVAGLLAARLPRRRGVVLVGGDLDDATVWQRAVVLGAEHVVFLPDAEAWVVDRVAASLAPDRSAVVVGVMPGCGGAGATTLAAGLAVTARRLGHATALIDGDPLGGGLDVALAAESVAGARWPQVAASGTLLADVIPAALPVVYGVPVLSWDRGDLVELSPGTAPSAVDAARRAADLVVVDVPRSVGDASAELCTTLDVLLVVTTGDLRAATATGRVAALGAAFLDDVRLVVRSGAAGALDPDVVAGVLGLPLAGRLRSDRGLGGELPAGLVTGGRSHLARFCTRLVRELVRDSAGGAAADAA